MDEHKTENLENFFDLNQEKAEKDENNDGRDEDVDIDDEVSVFSSSSKESVYVSCDETDASTTAECIAKRVDPKSNNVTNTVVEDDDTITKTNDATPKRVEETRESNFSYGLEVQYDPPRESCRTIVRRNLLDCLCCCCTPSSCGACNTRIRRQQLPDTVSVPQDCATRPPGGKVKITRAPGTTTITPYMASLGIISLEAYMELEAQKRAQESATATQATKKAEREAEFMQVVEDIKPKRVGVVGDNNTNADANDVTIKRVGRMKRFRKFLRRFFCCSGCRED